MTSSRHYYATSDEEEKLALKLALEASLADAGTAVSPTSLAASNGPCSSQPQPAPNNVYPAVPSNGMVPHPSGHDAYPQQQPQQQLLQQPSRQQRHWGRTLTPPPSPPPPVQLQQRWGRPATPQPVQQQQQQQQQGGNGSSSSSSNGGGGGMKLWQKPLKLLDSALQKVAAETGNQCGGCGKWMGVSPAYIKALGQQWHPQCFRCAGCQQPLTLDGANTTFAVGHDQLPYHAECHKQRFHPRCSVCQQYIPEGPSGRTEWREHPFWRLRQCPSHYADGTVSCCSCGRLQPQSEEWVGLQDGRHLCLACLDTLVIDTKDAQPLYDEILKFFVHMGMPHPYKAPLLLVEAPVLDDYAHREGRRQDAAHAPMFSVRGLCVAHVYTTIPSVVRAMGSSFMGAVNSINTRVAPMQQHCSVSTILVMYGLPRLLLGSIVAHELMHAYLRMRHVTGLPLQVEEGLCQLMAMLWLDSQDFWAKQAGQYQETLLSYLGYQIRTDTSEVYGDGFRIAMEKFQLRGLKALVEHVIAAGTWPAWTA